MLNGEKVNVQNSLKRMLPSFKKGAKENIHLFCSYTHQKKITRCTRYYNIGSGVGECRGEGREQGGWGSAEGRRPFTTRSSIVF